jgi:hypothetical protein
MALIGRKENRRNPSLSIVKLDPRIAFLLA